MRSTELRRSRNTARRLRELQTGQDRKFELVHREPVASERAAAVEKLIHNADNHHRIRGEWFSMSITDAVLEVQFAAIQYGAE